MVGGLLAISLLLEGGLRLFHPVGLHPTDTFLVPGWNEGGPSARAGFMTLVPGARTRYQHPEFDVAVRINSRGLRDREIALPKPTGTYRVLVLGDSQTFGVGVEAEETYAKVLERSLRASAGRPVEVINAGVPGTGTAHHLYFLSEQGWQYQPDAVVVGFFYNDVGDSGLCRLYRLEGDRLISTGPAASNELPFREAVNVPAGEQGVMVVRAPRSAPPPVPGFLVRNSHLVRFVRERLSVLKQARASRVPEERKSRDRALTARLIEELRRQCASRQAAFLLALIPSREECASTRIRDLSSWNEVILRPLNSHPEEVVDLLPAFRQPRSAALHFRDDQHMTVAGHQLAAERIAAQLSANDPRLRSATHTRATG